MPVATKDIVRRLYPARRKRRRKRLVFRPRYLVQRVARWAKRHAWKLAFMAAMVIVWAFAHIYYYNRLIDLEYNIQAAWAQVEAEQERRYNIQQDITRLVVGYAQHERDLMTKLTELRTGLDAARATRAVHGAAGATGTPGATPTAEAEASGSASSGAVEGGAGAPAAGLDVDDLSPSELNRIFPQILMTAEQYPNLRLTENFQQWSQSIIDTETRIAEHIQVYNDNVNKYTTLLKQFPANIFGAIWGFDVYEFYLPGRETIVFRPVNYRVDPTSGRAESLESNGRAAGGQSAPAFRGLPWLQHPPTPEPTTRPGAAPGSKPAGEPPKNPSTPERALSPEAVKEASAPEMNPGGREQG